jgi:hypothetical protein
MKRIFLFAASVAIILSCSRTDSDDPFSGTDLKARKVTPAVFTVTPGGSDDTPALLQAFEDA